MSGGMQDETSNPRSLCSYLIIVKKNKQSLFPVKKPNFLGFLVNFIGFLVIFECFLVNLYYNSRVFPKLGKLIFLIISNFGKQIKFFEFVKIL